MILQRARSKVVPAIKARVFHRRIKKLRLVKNETERCHRLESNQRHTDFQSVALPTELLRRGFNIQNRLICVNSARQFFLQTRAMFLKLYFAVCAFVIFRS